jgi:phenylpropionate dioxygenase-like ring-hydroxylating dioxygenase large terminal subunit
MAESKTLVAASNRLALPREGENGVFSQSWFPVMLAAELPPGSLRGCDFLDGRIILLRRGDGTVAAMSAYCPHAGADLSVGSVVDDHVRCAFHHWQYDEEGVCARTGIGDPPPRNARLFVFPVRERYGIIWVFNGETPLFELPDFPHPDSELAMANYHLREPFHCDPWVFAANTPDMQHLKVVHKIAFGVDDPHDLVKWHEFGLEFSYAGRHQGDVPIANTAGIRGTSVFYRWGQYGDFWRGTITGFGLPRPGQHLVFGCNVVLAGPAAEERLEICRALSQRTVGEDKDILDTIHYRQGTLTKGDRTLAGFLNYLRRFPRAHPSGPFIN